MKKSWEYDDKDPSEYLQEYAERFGEEQYELELPYLLWDIVDIAYNVKVALERNKTLSELYPDKYPMKMEKE